MGGEKIEHEFVINTDHEDWLKEMAQKHSLEDENKALRILIDFAMEDGDEESIFESIRCKRC